MARSLKFGIHVSTADFKPEPEIKTLYMGQSLIQALQVIKRSVDRLEPGVAIHCTILRLTPAMIAARERGDLRDLPGWMKEPGDP